MNNQNSLSEAQLLTGADTPNKADGAHAKPPSLRVTGHHGLLRLVPRVFTTAANLPLVSLARRKNDCFRCLAISEKHANVLMYKETYCQPVSDLDDLCSSINGDAPLYSMFRRDAPAAACPFRGPLTFSYNVGSGLCSTPASTIDSCTRDSRLLLRYQACPDMKGTESQEVKLECIGEWKEGTTKYFVGRIDSRKALTDEDKYRCFAWEHSREKGLYDFKMAQSEDATCNGVPSASDGAVILQIRKGTTRVVVGSKVDSTRMMSYFQAQHEWL
ncbi:hypothetical protein FHG87_016585 [Trinorchestia longiramus]|nr:hypothetical protein FHG87_016585 [Trinorchestia longiramus]